MCAGARTSRGAVARRAAGAERTAHGPRRRSAAESPMCAGVKRSRGAVAGFVIGVERAAYGLRRGSVVGAPVLAELLPGAAGEASAAPLVGVGAAERSRGAVFPGAAMAREVAVGRGTRQGSAGEASVVRAVPPAGAPAKQTASGRPQVATKGRLRDEEAQGLRAAAARGASWCRTGLEAWPEGGAARSLKPAAAGGAVPVFPRWLPLRAAVRRRPGEAVGRAQAVAGVGRVRVGGRRSGRPGGVRGSRSAATGRSRSGHPSSVRDPSTPDLDTTQVVRSPEPRLP